MEIYTTQDGECTMRHDFMRGYLGTQYSSTEFSKVFQESVLYNFLLVNLPFNMVCL